MVVNNDVQTDWQRGGVVVEPLADAMGRTRRRRRFGKTTLRRRRDDDGWPNDEERDYYGMDEGVTMAMILILL